MRRLEGIRAVGTQDLVIMAYNGDPVLITLVYVSAIQQWKIDIIWENFTLRGNRIFLSPNILSQYENIIPFGLGVSSDDNVDPFLVNDFSTGRANLYLLSEEELTEVRNFYVSL